MKFIKFSALCALLLLLTTGCFSAKNNNTSSSTLNEMDYLNLTVKELNKVGEKIDASHNNYEKNIPLEVKADEEITIDATDSTAAETQINDSQKAILNSNLKIDDQTKQASVEDLFREYIGKANSFVEKYKEVSNYYNNKTYQTDVAAAVDHETQIQQRYQDFQAAEDNIFTKIEELQQTSPYKAKLSSTDPIERLNASIDYLTDSVDTVYNAYIKDWDVKSEPKTIKENLAILETNEKTAQTNLAALNYTDPQVKPVKQYFDESYIKNLDAFITDMNKLITDYDSGTVQAENIDSYDISIQKDYEEIITSHNEIINLTNEALSTEE